MFYPQLFDMARLLHANEPPVRKLRIEHKGEGELRPAMSPFFTAVKKEATCLDLRHVQEAIPRRKGNIVRCPGFRDMPRHFVRDHGLALAPQDAGWRESGAITGGKSKGEEGGG